MIVLDDDYTCLFSFCLFSLSLSLSEQNSIGGSGGSGLSPNTRSQPGAALDTNFISEKSVPSPDTAHSDSASNLDFFNNKPELSSPEVAQPVPDFGFDMMDTSSTPPQPQPVQISADTQPGPDFGLFNKSSQSAAAPTVGVDFLSDNKSDNIFGSTASFTSLESDTNTGEDDSSSHANPDELGSFFQNSSQTAETAEALSSIRDPLTRAELEALANEVGFLSELYGFPRRMHRIKRERERGVEATRLDVTHAFCPTLLFWVPRFGGISKRTPRRTLFLILGTHLAHLRTIWQKWRRKSSKTIARSATRYRPA